MAVDLNDEFDKEQDLNSEFDQEQDLGASFEGEMPDIVKADEELSKNDSLWSQIASDVEPMSPGTVVSDIASIPGAVVNLVKQSPEELERIVQSPGDAAELAAKKMAQSASLAGPQHGLSAAYEKYVLAPILDKVRGEQDLKEALTTWVPERYQDRSVEDIAAQNIARQREQEAKFPVTATASSLAGPVALQAVGIPIPVTLGANKAGEVLEETGRPLRALSEGTKAFALTKLLDLAAAKAGQKVKNLPKSLKQAADLETAKAFGGTPGTLSKVGRERLMAAGEEAAPLVKGLSSHAELKDVLNQRIKQLGNTLESTVDDISGKISAADPEIISNVITKIDDNVQKTIIAPMAENLGLTSESPAMFVLSQKLKELRNIGRKTSIDAEGAINEVTKPSFKNLNEFKKALGDEISSWNKVPHERIPDAVSQRALRQLYHEVKVQLEEVANLTGDKGLKYAQTKQSISKLKDLQKSAYESARQELGQEFRGGMGDDLTPVIKQARFKWGPGLAGLEALHRGAKLYGAQIKSQLYRGLGAAPEALSKGIKSLVGAAEKAPGIGSNVQKLSAALSQMPQRFGQFAGPLLKAMPRGSTSLAATSYMLHQQYPEYRKMLEDLEKEEPIE